VAHGVLMLGGTFSDIANFDPVITGIIAEDESELDGEGRFDLPQWYPVHPLSINRFVKIGGYNQNLVVVPGQFMATTDENDPKTMGIQRLYSSLQALVYTSPSSETDYVAPSIWQVQAIPGSSNSLTFQAIVTDDDSGVMRVVVLYRKLTSNTWSLAELTYNAGDQTASQTVTIPGGGEVEYFFQAADNTGNVALGLNHNNYYRVTVTDDPISAP
jgi:hypothetical protein